MKYSWIQQHSDSFPVKTICKVMRVSTSGYYAWRRAVPSPRMHRSRKIRQDIVKVFQEHRQIYGSYKIADQMRNSNELETACRNTVASAMKEMGLKSRVSRRFRPTTTVTDPSKRPAPNVLDQVFDANGPNQKWVTDITYLPTAEGFVYLAVVLDLFSRKVVGWALSNSLATTVVSQALRKAIASRQPDTSELLLHSDRGCQYTSDEYQQVLRTLQITCSMSRKACCYDNAVMERFFWSLKHEWTKFANYADLETARLSVFEYIETFYNTKRIHQTLGYKTPVEFEDQHQNTLAM